jgi:hypothetical protein
MRRNRSLPVEVSRRPAGEWAGVGHGLDDVFTASTESSDVSEAASVLTNWFQEGVQKKTQRSSASATLADLASSASIAPASHYATSIDSPITTETAAEPITIQNCGPPDACKSTMRPQHACVAPLRPKC